MTGLTAAGVPSSAGVNPILLIDVHGQTTADTAETRAGTGQSPGRATPAETLAAAGNLATDGTAGSQLTGAETGLTDPGTTGEGKGQECRC